MLKRIIAVCLIVICGFLVFCLFAGQAERTAYIKQQRHLLKIAAEDLVKYGYVTNVWSNTDRFYRSSNIVTIADKQYQCYAEVSGGQFGDEGTLAITTDQVFIWLGSNRPPKVIDSGYKASLGHF
jgi:hypothetical protein